MFVIVICAFYTDIDQLTRILLLCGTPDLEFLGKITSDEVGLFALYLSVLLFHLFLTSMLI